MPQTVRHTLENQIDQLTHEILSATEKAWEAQKNKKLKQNVFWLDEKRKLTEERTQLQKKLHQTPLRDEDSIKPQTRQEIKEKIIHLNKQALSADKNMRHALEEKELSQANTYLRQRNQYNAEVKNLNKLLNPENTNKVKNKVVEETKPQALSKKDIKEKIKKYNKRAVEADTNMRIALKEKKLEKANELLQQRNYLNAESKKLTHQLSALILTRKKETEAQVPTITTLITPETNEKPQYSNQSITNKAVTNDPLGKEALKNKIRSCNKKAREMDKKMRIALEEKKLLDANELLQQRNRYNNKAKELLKKLQLFNKKKQAIHYNHQPIKEKIKLNRDELKNKLKTANSNALNADHSMRLALNEKNYQEANRLLKQRNAFNLKAKKITLLLNPITVPEPKPIIQDNPTIEKKEVKVETPISVIEKLSEGFGIIDTKATAEQPSKKQPIPSVLENKIEQPSTLFAMQVAQKTINYRLGFIKFFYKKRDLQAQIDTANKNTSTKHSNEKITPLNKELVAHLKYPPKAYVEDHAHNEIILHLLDKVDEMGAAYFDFPEITSTSIGAPLKQFKRQQDLTDFIQGYTEKEQDSGSGKRVLLKYFIRDVIQVKCPLTICDLVLEDAIMDTATMEYGFVNLFDKIVNEVNQEIIRLQDASDDPLMPKVLRPIRTFDFLGHRDAIQLIPPANNGIDQFSGAILEDTTLQDNVISSSARLQGIFSTDGAFKNLKIINNQVNTEGEHKIVVLGMLSGEVSGNTDLDGKALDVKIQPLRLGGGTPLTNFFILGFSEQCSYQYGLIEGISGTAVDRRSKKVVQGHKAYDQRKYLLDFNMDRFIEYYQSHTKSRGRFVAIKDCIEKMLAEGDAIKCTRASLDALENGASLAEAVTIAQSKERYFAQSPQRQQQSF
ncbi:MAG: hypothetical protein KAG20_00160 [Cocleimonas sp.]|nr:hypothetical protein [Cocleimonas sp.]